jgi:hypothetical protein
VYPLRQGDDVLVGRAYHNALMIRHLGVQLDEIPTIEGYDSTCLGDGKSELVRIGNPLAGSPRLLGGEHVMPEPAQFVNDPSIKVLVSIQPGHYGLGPLVLPDGLLDFLRVLLIISPGCVQLGLGEGREESSTDALVRHA